MSEVHFRVTCPKCGAVVRQCRCPSLNKVESHEVCSKCSGEIDQKIIDSIPENRIARLEAALVAADLMRDRAMWAADLALGANSHADHAHTVKAHIAAYDLARKASKETK